MPALNKEKERPNNDVARVLKQNLSDIEFLYKSSGVNLINWPLEVPDSLLTALAKSVLLYLNASIVIHMIRNALRDSLPQIFLDRIPGYRLEAGFLQFFYSSLNFRN